MAQDDLGALADANYYEGLRRVASAMDGSEVVESDDSSSSGCPA